MFSEEDFNVSQGHKHKKIVWRMIWPAEVSSVFLTLGFLTFIQYLEKYCFSITQEKLPYILP